LTNTSDKLALSQLVRLEIFLVLEWTWWILFSNTLSLLLICSFSVTLEDKVICGIGPEEGSQVLRCSELDFFFQYIDNCMVQPEVPQRDYNMKLHSLTICGSWTDQLINLWDFSVSSVRCEEHRYISVSQGSNPEKSLTRWAFCCFFVPYIVNC